MWVGPVGTLKMLKVVGGVEEFRSIELQYYYWWRDC